jgi:hypothetical protein
MYTAKVLRKEEDNGVVKVFVTFTDGVNTQTEWCIPQDRAGFDLWVKSRLAVFNTGQELQTDLVDGADIDVSDPVVVPPVLTQDEIDRNTWLTKYHRWLDVKFKLVDSGIVPVSNTKVTAMLADLKTTLKAEYIDYI